MSEEGLNIVVSFLASSGILGAIATFVIKKYVRDVQNSFSKIVDEVKGLRDDFHKKDLFDSKQDGRLYAIEGRVKILENRANKFSDKIRDVELKLAKL